MTSQSHQFSLDPTIPDPSADAEADYDDLHDISFSKRGCCYWIPFLTSKRGPATGSFYWQRISTSETEHKPVTDPSWTRGWKRLREWSEIVAGPRWKTFIRTFRKNRSCFGGGGGARQSKFQYDPSSYAMNFDDGQVLDEDLAARDFSSRYASVPASAKASMDVGKDPRIVHVSATCE